MNKFTLKEIIELINLLRIDVFMFVYIFGFMLPNVTLNQLVQDKICLNEFKYDPKFCLDLGAAEPQFEVQKNKVLEYATTMKNYQTLIATTPGVVLSLFIGYWIDSYPSHLKYLLSAPAVGAIIQAFMVIYDAINFERHPATTLYSFISIGFSGGIGLVFAGTYIYTTRMTPVKYRSVRFSVLEFFAFSGFPVATALGGKILALDPWFPNQYRNYIAVFFITIAANLFGIIWIILFLKEEEPVSAQNQRSLEKSNTSTSLNSCSNNNNNNSTNNNNNLNLIHSNNNHNNNNNNNSKDENEKIINNLNNSINSVLNGSSGNELLELKSDLTGLGLQVVDDQLMIKSNGSLTSINTNVSNNIVNSTGVVVKSSSRSTSSKTMDLIKDIFNLNNVRSMIKTCCRRRPNKGRLRLWHLMMGMTVALIGHLGEAVIGYQFTQKVYHWDAEYFSYVNSALTVIPSVVQTISPAILIHKFHLHDTTVAGIGCISIMISTIVKGGILESYAYFIAFIAGAFSGTLPIAFRSLVSRLIDFNEIGQVYALLACIESCAPMISSIFYSTVFNATIENYPGTVFHAVTLIFFYPLMVILWLDLTRSKWDVQVNNPAIITIDDQEGGNNNINCGKIIDPPILVAPPELIIENLIV